MNRREMLGAMLLGPAGAALAARAIEAHTESPEPGRARLWIIFEGEFEGPPDAFAKTMDLVRAIEAHGFTVHSREHAAQEYSKITAWRDLPRADAERLEASIMSDEMAALPERLRRVTRLWLELAPQ